MTVYRCRSDQIAAIITALTNNARAIGMGLFQDTPTTLAEQTQHVEAQLSRGASTIHIDYVNGRPIKMLFVHQDDDTWSFDTPLYNRDQGEGAAEQVLTQFGLK